MFSQSVASQTTPSEYCVDSSASRPTPLSRKALTWTESSPPNAAQSAGVWATKNRQVDGSKDGTAENAGSWVSMFRVGEETQPRTDKSGGQWERGRKGRNQQ